MLRKEYAENPFQKEEYGRLLKLALGRRNQKQFCEDAGLSRSYINKYINAMMDKTAYHRDDRKNCRCNRGCIL